VIKLGKIARMDLIRILKENGTGVLSGHFKSNSEKSWNGDLWNTPNGKAPKFLEVKFSLGKEYLGEFKLEKLEAGESVKKFDYTIGQIKHGKDVIEVELKYTFGYSNYVGEFNAVLI
jgi:hypothetical protein